MKKVVEASLILSLSLMCTAAVLSLLLPDRPSGVVVPGTASDVRPAVLVGSVGAGAANAAAGLGCPYLEARAAEDGCPYLAVISASSMCPGLSARPLGGGCPYQQRGASPGGPEPPIEVRSPFGPRQLASLQGSDPAGSKDEA